MLFYRIVNAFFIVFLGIIIKFYDTNMRFFLSLITLFFTLSSYAELDDGLYANLHTNKGDIIVKLNYKKTPLTVINFAGLAEGTKHSNIQTGKPFYNGLKFHRVIDNFMIQGGDPKGNGTGGPGYKFVDEITDLTHNDGGILSMANSGANTNGSQFFITHKATPWLDGKHTVFGHVVEGMGVVNSIEQDDFIRKVKIIRIGKDAQNFKTDEAAFVKANGKYQAKKDLAKAKKSERIAKFVKTSYPNAKENEDGYFVDISQNGKGDQPNKGDLVKVALAIDTDEGFSVRKADEPLQFAPGTGKIIKIIDSSVLAMKAGEKRTIIAHYSQVYGNNKTSSPLANALLIFNIELLSINELD